MPRFAIGTTNIPKSEAVEHVIMTCPYFSWQHIHFSHHKVQSWVADMPTTLEQLRTWAKNRAQACKKLESDADYFIGMEWWVYKDQIWEEYWYVWVVYIENWASHGNWWYSGHLKVPPRVAELLFDGRNLDLEEVMQELTGEESVWDKKGSGAVWSDGFITRQEQFIIATKCALIATVSPFYTNQKHGNNN